MPFFLYVVGLAFILYGAWLIHPAAALIVWGLFLWFVSVMVAVAKKNDSTKGKP